MKKKKKKHEIYLIDLKQLQIGHNKNTVPYFCNNSFITSDFEPRRIFYSVHHKLYRDQTTQILSKSPKYERYNGKLLAIFRARRLIPATHLHQIIVLNQAQ